MPHRLLLGLIALTLLLQGAAGPSEYFAYVGNYGKGIYAYRYSPATARFQPLGMAAAIDSPSFLALDPNQQVLYAVSELTGPNNPVGSVSAFSIDRKNGGLKAINTVSAEGTSPCHLATDRTGKLLLVANYGDGTVAVYPIGSGGALGKASQVVRYTGSSVDKGRQEGPHAHEIVISADNRYAFVPDLGLDRLHILTLNPSAGKVTTDGAAFTATAPGSGPRHMVLHPAGKFAYVVSELKSVVTAYSYDPGTGMFRLLQTLPTVPANLTVKNYPAEIALDAAGKFLYVSNRGHDSIAIFQVDRAAGTLTEVQIAPAGGSVPRSFAIDPGGKHLLVGSQKLNRIVVFNIDSKTGRIRPSGQALAIPSPVCITFAAAVAN